MGAGNGEEKGDRDRVRDRQRHMEAYRNSRNRGRDRESQREKRERTENGERRTENGERRTENGERRTENGGSGGDLSGLRPFTKGPGHRQKALLSLDIGRLWLAVGDRGDRPLPPPPAAPRSMCRPRPRPRSRSRPDSHLALERPPSPPAANYPPVLTVLCFGRFRPRSSSTGLSASALVSVG